jgi:hypothetical protein
MRRIYLMAKIQITKNRPYELVVVVKQPGSLTPLEMSPNATAKFYLVEKSSNVKLIEKNMERYGQLEEGKFIVKLTETDTVALPVEYGITEDGGSFIDNCRAHVAITDTDAVLDENQHIDIIIESVTIVDMGE